MTLDELLLNNGGWLAMDSWSGQKGSWFRTREVARLPEGAVEMEKSTVLRILAEVKFPEGWDKNSKAPYWIDKDPFNETLDNVGLITQLGESVVGRVSTLGIPYPSSSLEYRREYQKRNRAKFNEYNKQYQKRARAALRAQRKSSEPPPDANVRPVEDSHLDDMQRMLQQIEEMTKGENTNGTDHRD